MCIKNKAQRYYFVTKLICKRLIIVNLKRKNSMSFWRVVLSIICPPLAVMDKGCGSILIVFILWCLGWVPGVIAALIILNNPKS